jgi:hypothetical protein
VDRSDHGRVFLHACRGGGPTDRLGGYEIGDIIGVRCQRCLSINLLDHQRAGESLGCDGTATRCRVAVSGWELIQVGGAFERLYSFAMNMSFKPDAANPAMALWLAIEDQRRRVADLERWPLRVCHRNEHFMPSLLRLLRR